MESKDHKWREAPVVVINNFSNKPEEFLEKQLSYPTNYLPNNIETTQKSKNYTQNLKT